MGIEHKSTATAGRTINVHKVTACTTTAHAPLIYALSNQ